MSVNKMKTELEIAQNAIENAYEIAGEMNDSTPKETRNLLVLRQAASEIGTKEWKDGSNPKVERYLDHGSRRDNADSGLSDDIPWCAGFIAYVLETVGMGSTNSLMARSYEGWGKPSHLDPLPGDIVTFYRNGRSSGQGHVAFYIKKVGNFVYCLGGNQNDEVNITRYSTDRMTEIRRTSKDYTITKDQRRELNDLAIDIMSGKNILPGGKVT